MAQAFLAGDPDLRLFGGVHRTVFATRMEEFSLLELQEICCAYAFIARSDRFLCISSVPVQACLFRQSLAAVN